MMKRWHLLTGSAENTLAMMCRTNSYEGTTATKKVEETKKEENDGF